MTTLSQVSKFQDQWYSSAPVDERKKFKIWLQNTLDTGIVSVTFKKLNGQLRHMKATTNLQLIPEQINNSVDSDSCVVWDCEKLDYRQFKYENITDIDFKLED